MCFPPPAASPAQLAGPGQPGATAAEGHQVRVPSELKY